MSRLFSLDALLSLREGRILMPHPVDTMTEGLRTSLGDLTLSMLQDHLQDGFVVDEEEIIPAMRIAFERMKLVIEPSSAVALAPFFAVNPLCVKHAWVCWCQEVTCACPMSVQ